MSRPKSERRCYPRYEVTDLTGSLVVPVTIEVLNLSLGGMAVETSSCLQFGREYTLKLDGGDGLEVSLSGSVAWCSLRRTSRSGSGEVVPIYRAGLKFASLDSEYSQGLWNLIQSHAVVDIEDSVLGRFKVEMPSATQLGSSYDFSVRKLSLAGILIETDFAPRVDANFQLQLRLGHIPWQSKARVVSIPTGAEPEKSGLVRVGLEFVGLGRREVAQLRSFLDTRLPKPRIP